MGDGERGQQAFDLRSDVYELTKFTVISDREGNAASITRQRNSDSVKHVVSMDSFGNLANDNAGELLLRLPGISGVHDLDGNISTVNIRGTPGNLNMVTVDGNLMASNFGDSRNFAMRSISGALFEEIEVTKAPTPDMPADSIGGAINMKSASPLDMKANRRITYGASFRWAPNWIENVPMAHDHPLHPTLKLNWQEVFSVFGGQRNLGLTFSTFYSENASGGHTGTNAYESTLNKRAYQYDYQSRDLYNNRKQKSASVKLDYRVSPTTTIRMGALLNQDDQPFNRQITFRAATSQTVATLDGNGNPTGTGAILPNYTETFTEARPINNSVITLTQITIGTVDDQGMYNLGAKHKFDRFELDYSGAYSTSSSVLNTGEHGDREGGGNFTQTVRSIGWTVDRSDSEHYPVFNQVSGVNLSDPNVYIPGTMTRRNNSKDIDILTLKADAKYLLPTELPVNVKFGFHHRSQELRRTNADRQWAPTNTSAGALASLVDLDRVTTSFEERYGAQIPYIDAADIVSDIAANPSRWKEDLYYATTRKYIGNDLVHEDVTAGYLQSQVQFGKLKAVAGVRYERTDVMSEGYVASLSLTTTAQRNADPVGSGIKDWNNLRRNEGSTTNGSRAFT
ncbi:MAG: TonB-dependent receptor plug domain-containing protein [Magnetospirillum sp.]|nr:TonB-dependent receptor plug domain-containing protein [Magnetospirillum sp.]